MLKRLFTVLSFVLIATYTLSPYVPVMAQDEQPPAGDTGLALVTNYPSQVIGLGEAITLQLFVRTDAVPQVVALEMAEVPKGWTVTFRGGGRIIKSAFVEPDADASVELRIEPPPDVQAGTYKFVAVATVGEARAELPIELTVQEKLPPRLTWEVELPTLKGTPTTTFRYATTLKNEGDDELTVNLSATASELFLVSFKLTGQDVTNIPVGPKESKSLSVEVQSIGETSAGAYPIEIMAQGGEAQAILSLTAEVTGQSQLLVTAPDGRLSGQANAGRETPLKVVVNNNGSASARNIELTSSAPNGWAVTFEPQQIAEIPAGQQVEVTTSVRPADNAVAGDYMVTVRASPADGAVKSADFRITVLTSTLWGVVGIILIAIAVGVVAMAVMRFGRR